MLRRVLVKSIVERIRLALAITAALCAWLPLHLPAQNSLPARIPSSAVAQFLDVAQLPHLRRSVIKVGSFSSYDRTGGNNDGFAGTYSFLRKESDGGLVIAELQGPGALTRIWTTYLELGNPAVVDDTVEFFFDGEAVARLRLPFRELFTGTHAPFLAPLSGGGVGGFYSYVPLEFATSLKVVVRTKVFHFYQINYLQYAPGTAVRTFQLADRAPPAPVVDSAGRTLTKHGSLLPGQTMTLFHLTRPGRIVTLRVSPADAFAGMDRAVALRIYWDGATRPAVDVPLGDFFGYYFGEPAVHSVVVGTDGQSNYIRFPMPFAHSARIELVSRRTSGPAIPVHATLVVASRGKTPDEGFFHATWTREDPVPLGRPFTYLDVRGAGHLVGVTLQAQGTPPGTGFFEGDDAAIIDGDTTVHGTGSEDFFNGGWYDVPGRWDHRESLLWSGALGYDAAHARTGGFRLFLGDAYVFQRRLTVTMEHGGEGNTSPTDYTGVAYYYLDRPEGIGPAL